ncbi:MAG: cellulose binding domain-containing protein [Oscillospiraceae bacterium]|jgi:hypothetical protein|nr:cellulose binding domain-containing protein [Oscillospiraceae bacterium]
MNLKTRKFKRVLAFALSMALIITGCISGILSVSANENEPQPYNMTILNTNERIYHGENYDVLYRIVSFQDDNQSVNLTITNKGTEIISNWALYYEFGSEEISNVYSSQILENEYFSYITHENYNFGEISPYSSASFGYTLGNIEERFFPDSIDMVQSRVAKDSGFSAELSGIYDAWNNFCGNLNITNNTDIPLCKGEFTINSNFKLLSNWGYDVVEVGENTYTIKSKFDHGLNLNIPPNSTLSLAISGSKEGENWTVATPQITSMSVTEMSVSAEEYLSRDSDGDEIPDYYENILLSDRYNVDSDSDLLPDNYEFYTLGTALNSADTDNDGISDTDEDLDEDLLSNYQEFELTTDPLEKDTDGDYLIDGEEVNLGTDPFNQDSDGDTLLDGDEGVNSTIYTESGIYFDPTLFDTDGNGISDGDEKFEQSYQQDVVTSDGAITNISVEMNTNGNIDTNLSIESMMDIDIMSSKVVGLIGEPFDFTMEFEESKPTSDNPATITFSVDKAKLSTDFDKLTVLWYNEEDGIFVDCSEDTEFTVALDEVNSTISVTTPHFSQYLVIDSQEWYKAWSDSERNLITLAPPSTGSSKPETVHQSLNIVFAVDITNSTAKYDMPSNSDESFCKRAEIVENFMKNGSVSDKYGIVLFDEKLFSASYLSEYEGNVLNHLQSLKDKSLNTTIDLNKLLTKSVQILNSEVSDPLTKKVIVLLSSGSGPNISTQTLETLKSSNISVYSVIFGNNNSDRKKMINLSTETNGEWYDVGVDASDIIIWKDNSGIIWIDNSEKEGNLNTETRIDITDTDEDGLPDVIERYALKPNGTPIGSYPNVRIP